MGFLDIRKLYIGKMLNNDIENKKLTEMPEGKKTYGVFVRTLGGYKHLLTNTTYYKSSGRCNNEHIIDAGSIKLLIKKEREYCLSFVNNCRSCYVDTMFVVNVEKMINDETHIKLMEELER